MPDGVVGNPTKQGAKVNTPSFGHPSKDFATPLPLGESMGAGAIFPILWPPLSRYERAWVGRQISLSKGWQVNA